MNLAADGNSVLYGELIKININYRIKTMKRERTYPITYLP